MRKILAIMVCVLCIVNYAEAQSFNPQASAPEVNMQSVNNSTMMSSGSIYRADVQEVGAYSPSASGVRKAPPGHSEGFGYDPETPKYDQPLGDAVLPLMLIALAYVGVIYVRRKRNARA